MWKCRIITLKCHFGSTRFGKHCIFKQVAVTVGPSESVR